MDLLERAQALTTLASALDEAVRGSGRLVLVSGEAGIGKTALVRQFVRDHGGRGRVLWGLCDQLFTPHPLGPLHDMAPLMDASVKMALTSETDRFTLYGAVLADLQRGPTIAIIEDIHWADEATLDLLRFLSRRIAQTSALLILTHRDDELHLTHPLRLVLGDLAATAVRRVPLAPLSRAAVRTLVGQRPIDAPALHRQTGGNPFFVSEVIASEAPGLPGTIRDAVLARAARLSSTAQAVLQAAAVIGPRIEPWLLSAVTAAAMPAVTECLNGGMLVTSGEGFAFRHELARQAVLDAIAAPQRVALHRLALAMLRDTPSGRAHPVRLAHYAAGAGDRAAVLAYAPVAAEQASAATAHRSAATLYQLALSVADGLPPAEHAALLEAYARQCTWSDQRAAAITSRTKAVELWQAADNPLKQGESLANLALALVGSDRWAEAEPISQTAIQLLEGLPPGRALALAYRHRAWLLRCDHQLSEAIQLAERAVALAEQVGDIHVLGMALDTLGGAWLFRDYERGRQYLDRCLTVAQQAGLEGRIASVHGTLGAASCALYRLDEAERALAEGLAFAADRDVDIVRSYMLGWQALVHLHRGRWTAAEGTATLVAYRPAVSDHNRVAALVALGRIRARRGDDDAQAPLDEALRLAERSGCSEHLGLVRAARAEAAWLAGDTAQTVTEADAATLMISRQHAWLAGELAYWRWRAGAVAPTPAWLAEPFAHQLAGDWATAATAWEQRGCPYEQARALAEGDQAAQLQALALFDRLGARPAAAQLRHRLRSGGAVHVPRGPQLTSRTNPYGLTARQLAILGLMAAGLSNAQIAARLSIALKTVDHHVSAVLAKLGVHSREAAASLAWREHLIDPP